MPAGAETYVDEDGATLTVMANPGYLPEEARGRQVYVVWERDRHRDRVTARRLPADPPTNWAITGQSYDIAFYGLAS